MKTLYTFAFVLFAHSLFAQQQAGDLSIQFSGNYISQRIVIDNKTTKIYAGNIYIKFGKFFTQNIELGVKPNIFFSPRIETNPRDPNDTKTKLKASVGLGLYGAYSYLTADGKFMPYAGVEVNYVPSDDEATVNLGPYGGVKYFVTERINIDANVNYLINLASTYGNETRDLGLEIKPLFQLNIGVGVIIGKTE
jgi:outer membrane protein W